MKREYTLIIALGVFLAFGMLAIEFLKKPVTANKIPIKESFYSAPTKISDCNCLPGYIASNTFDASKYGGKVINYKGAIMFVPDGAKDIYWIPQCVMCNNSYNFCDPKVYKNIYEKEYKSYTYKGTFNCDLQKDANTTKELPTYFCQKLSDPSERKECY